MRLMPRAYTVCMVLLALLGFSGYESRGQNTVDFDRDIKPILRDNCWECHGPDRQMGSLRLDRREFAIAGGRSRMVYVPGVPERSLLFRRITGMDRPQMPPIGPLADEAVASIKTWIETGAVWPDDALLEHDWQEDPRVTALMQQMRSGDFQPVRLAVSQEPQLAQARDARGRTLLTYAVLYSPVEDVEFLLAAGSDANSADLGGMTPLMLAVDDARKTRVLLEKGADPNARSIDGRAALSIAVDRLRSSDVVSILIEYGADTDARPGQTDPLIQVARNGDLASMKLIAAQRGGRFPQDALNAASLSSCVPCVQLILDHKPSVEALSQALLASVIMARTEVLTMLIEAGANVNTADEDGVTALMKAAYSDFIDPPRIQLLLDNGADVNARGRDGRTALSEALKKGSTQAAAMLVAAGAKE